MFFKKQFSEPLSAIPATSKFVISKSVIKTCWLPLPRIP